MSGWELTCDAKREIDEPGNGEGHDASTGGLLSAFKKYAHL